MHEAVEAGTSTAHYWIAAAIFGLSYAIIMSEKIHKTKVALMGATLMIALSVLSQTEAFHSPEFGVDYNVIFLLIAMMIMVNVMGESGIFEWMAITFAKLGKGSPMRIMIIFVVFTAFASAFLDNVTTVILLAPVTLLIADELELDPVPFLLIEAIASNIGGTATLIGDPPNLLIASRAKLGFMDFIEHLAPVVLVMVVFLILTVWLLFRKRLKVTEEKRLRVMNMDANRLIKDKGLATKSVIIMGLTILGFTLHSVLHMEPATVALLGASVLMLISGRDPHKVFANVEWNTIFFFIGLFIIVGGVVKVGLISELSTMMIKITDPQPDNMFMTSMVMLWFSGIASAIIDNIPFVATMAPLIQDMANTLYHEGAHHAGSGNLPMETLRHDALMPVWWALALGACLGGNGSPIGASANVMVLGIAEKAGHHISFMRWLKYGVPITFGTLLVSMVYIWLRYY